MFKGRLVEVLQGARWLRRSEFIYLCTNIVVDGLRMKEELTGRAKGCHRFFFIVKRSMFAIRRANKIKL